MTLLAVQMTTSIFLAGGSRAEPDMVGRFEDAFDHESIVAPGLVVSRSSVAV